MEQHTPLVPLSLLFGVNGDDDVTVGKEGRKAVVQAGSVGRRWAAGLPPHGLCVFFYFFFLFVFSISVSPFCGKRIEREK